jgi:flagellar motor protein MotB
MGSDDRKETHGNTGTSHSIASLKAHGAFSHDDDDGDHGGGGGGGGHESDEHLWLYSFNDMLFNLLLFFIVMFAISSVNKAKFAAVAEAMQLPKGTKQTNKPIAFQKENSITRADPEVDTYVQCSNPIVPARKEGTEKGAQGTFPGKANVEGKTSSQMSRPKVLETVFQGNDLFVAGTSTVSARGEKLLKSWAKKALQNDQMSRIEVESVVPLLASRAAISSSRKPAAVETASERRTKSWELAAKRSREVLDKLGQNGISESLVWVSARGPSIEDSLRDTAETSSSAKVVVRLVEASVSSP